jgi:hypothetical protein
MATTKSDRNKSGKGLKNLIIVLIVLIIFIGIPYLFLNYQAHKSGMSMGGVRLWTNNGSLIAGQK